MAAGIIAIEVMYTIPLLILIHFNGDTDVIINEDNPPFTNVKQCYPICIAHLLQSLTVGTYTKLNLALLNFSVQ